MNIVCNLKGHEFRENRVQGKGTYYSHSCTRCNVHADFSSRNPEVIWKKTVWDSETWEIIKIVLKVIFWVSLGALIVIALFSWMNYSTCNSYANMGIKAEWNFWTACMAEHPKFGWLPIDEYFRTLNLNIPME